MKTTQALFTAPQVKGGPGTGAGSWRSDTHSAPRTWGTEEEGTGVQGHLCQAGSLRVCLKTKHTTKQQSTTENWVSCPRGGAQWHSWNASTWKAKTGGSPGIGGQPWGSLHTRGRLLYMVNSRLAWVQSLGPAWWKKRTNNHKLSSVLCIQRHVPACECLWVCAYTQ